LRAPNLSRRKNLRVSERISFRSGACRGESESRRQFSASAGSSAAVLPPRHDGQNTKNMPPVLPDASSASGKNIVLSETKKL
jgi:hypothetical protein